MMDDQSKSQKNSGDSGTMVKLFKVIWMITTLPIGYIFSALIIFSSKRSPEGYWSDLKGIRGRVLACEWGESVIIAFIMAIFIRTFFIQAFKIPSGSMRPTLKERDRLIVNKLRYGSRVPFTKNKRLPGFSEPKRGDVIVFVYPGDKKRDFIKRLIGFEGEAIEIKEGDIYVNGAVAAEPIIKNTTYYNRGEYGREGKPVTVPENHYFVLGDNSGSSSDGRFWGFVPEENIIGRAEVIYFPFNRMRLIK